VQVTGWADDKSVITEYGSTDIAKLNDEDDDFLSLDSSGVGGAAVSYLAFVFPVAYRCSHIKVILDTASAIQNSSPVLERSDDTTNGRDGNWTTEATVTGIASEEAARPNYRESIFSVGASTARKAWRLKLTRNTTIANWLIRAIHFYGVEYGHTDRLSFWDGTLNQELTPDLNYADVARGAGQQDLTFRVKNVSPTLTATSVLLTIETGPSYAGMAAITTISSGGAFGSSCTLANIAPNTIGAETITLRFGAGGVPLGTEIEALTCRVTPSATFV
jgi:hypothetical protein